MCKAKVYENSGGTQEIGEVAGGFDSRLDTPDPRDFYMKAGVCLQCNITVNARRAADAERKVRELLEKEGTFEIEGIETILQGIEFIDVVDREAQDNN